MSEHRVNPELLHRTASGEILSGMHSRVSISMAFASVAKSCGQFYLATCITGMSVVHTDNNAGI